MAELIVVFGGSGFVGKHVVRALCKAGFRVRVAMRRPQLGQELRVMGNVGQVQLVQANVRDYESVARALDGANGAINLVGLLYEKGKQKFGDVMDNGAQNIARACKVHNISKLVHVSAIVDKDSRAKYALAKIHAENAIKETLPSAVILRPSVIFGADDGFFNLFAGISRITPIMPLIGGGQTKFQPVFVGDVARAIMAAMGDAATGKTFELGGPQSYTFEQILRFIASVTNRPRAYLKLPFWLVQMKGNVLDFIFRFIPFAAPPLTGDQVELMRSDNVVADNALGFDALGITDLSTIEAITPSYLARFRPHGQFEPRIANKTI